MATPHRLSVWCSFWNFKGFKKKKKKEYESKQSTWKANRVQWQNKWKQKYMQHTKITPRWEDRELWPPHCPGELGGLLWASWAPQCPRQTRRGGGWDSLVPRGLPSPLMTPANSSVHRTPVTTLRGAVQFLKGCIRSISVRFLFTTADVLRCS